MITFLVIGWGSLVLLILSSFLNIDDHHSAQAHDHGLGSVLSIQSLLLFGIGFGNVGAIGLSYGRTVTESMGLGVVFGLLLGVLGMQMMKALKGTESDSTQSLSGIVNYSGRVTHPITPSEPGEVQVLYQGRTRFIRAYAEEVIPIGKQVKITATSGGDVYVRPL
jgi:membrane protein implicated in regulation of membrane protease activity